MRADQPGKYDMDQECRYTQENGRNEYAGNTILRNFVCQKTMRDLVFPPECAQTSVGFE